MKKSLLLAVAAVLATSAFAKENAGERVKNTLPMRMVKQTALDAREVAPKSVARAFSDGVYYVPQNVLWRGWGLDGYGSGYSMIGCAPYTPVVYKNMMADVTKSKWTTNGNAKEADANGDFTAIYSSRGGYVAPVISDSITSYSFGERNIFAKRVDERYGVPLVYVDTVACFSVVDDHLAIENKGQWYTNTSTWGALNTDNLYGSGTLDDGSVSVAVLQIFPALHSNLSVECVAVEGFTFTKPIKNGAKLRLDILPVVFNEATQKWGINYDEPMETLFASEKDTLGFSASDANTRNGKTVYRGKVLFSKKVLDEFDNPTIENFTIPANQRFAVYISGFEDQTNIDLGVLGLEGGAEDKFDYCYFECYDSKEDAHYNHYYEGLAGKIYLNGMFDKVIVPENGLIKGETADVKYNVLRVSADGSTVTTEGSDNNCNLKSWPIITAIEFYDHEGNANYDFEINVENSEEWLKFQYDASKYDENGGITFFQPVCQPLPDGVTKRAAAIYIKGRGVEGDRPLLLLQGDATIADGIAAIENGKKASNTVVYNLQGQKVAENAKGLLIKNGKKFFNK